MPFKPLFMKDVTFTVDATDYAAQLASVLFQQDSSTVPWKGLKPSSVFTEATAPSYTCQVKYAQDWNDPASFSNWLYDNSGTSQLVTFKPSTPDTPSFTATIQVVSGPIGGDVDTYAEATVTLGSDWPAKVPPA